MFSLSWSHRQWTIANSQRTQYKQNNKVELISISDNDLYTLWQWIHTKSLIIIDVVVAMEFFFANTSTDYRLYYHHHHFINNIIVIIKIFPMLENIFRNKYDCFIIVQIFSSWISITFRICTDRRWLFSKTVAETDNTGNCCCCYIRFFFLFFFYST